MIGLVRCAGTGTAADPFRPALEEGAVEGAIDLRPDCTKPDGLWVVRTSAAVEVPLGDDPDARPTAARRRLMETRLGVTLADRQLRRIVADLLIEHGDDANPRRWNRLRPGVHRRLEVWLGGAVPLWEMAVPAGSSTLAESFDKADSSTLGPDLTWAEVTGDWTIVSNRAKQPVAAAAAYSARAEHDLASSDHYAQAQCKPQSTSNVKGGVCARFDSAAETGYLALGVPTSSLTRLQKIVAGAASQIGTTSADTYTAGSDHLLRCEANGSTIKAYLGGTQRVSVTDTSITTGTRTGLHAEVPANLARFWTFNDFAAGDLGATVVAVAATATAAAQAPAVTGGATVSPPPATATGQAQTPAVTGAASVSATAATASASAAAPAVTGGATVTAAAATATAQVEPPTVTGGATVTAVAATASAQAEAPTVAVGAEVTATAATAAASATAPSVTGGATVTATPAAATEQAVPPTVTGGATTTATAATANAIARTPTVTGGATVTALPATATATAPAPTFTAGATVASVTATATATARVPSVVAYTAAVTPDERIYVVAAESRTGTVAAETRTWTVPAETRVAAGGV